MIFIYKNPKELLTLVILMLQFHSVMSQNSDAFSETVKIEKDKYIDKTEIDIGSWLSYYTWVLQNEGFLAAQKILPDSNAVEPEVWAYINTKSIEFIDWQGQHTGLPIGYFNLKCKEAEKYGYSFYYPSSYCLLLSLPITGITFEQAVEFCKWRTKVLGKNKITCRLPTPEEWTEIATNGFTDKEKINQYKDSLVITKNCTGAGYNYNYTNLIGKHYCSCQFKKEKNEISDIFGNVSEMTSVKGKAKGGNFTLYAKQCHVDSVQYYSKPEKWLGFRCIIIKGEYNYQPVNTNNLTQVQNKQKSDTVCTIIWDGKFGEYTDNRDRKKYKIVKIGNQIWMAQNLAYKPTEGKYWAYQNDENNVPRFGYLYTWETAIKVCPSGWHLPQKEEFEMLLSNVGTNSKTLYSNLIISGSSGFSIILCGLRYGINFTPNDLATVFWSSTERKNNTTWGLGIDGSDSIVKLYDTYSKKSGLPVRCIQDN